MRKKTGDKGGDLLRAGLKVLARNGFDNAKVAQVSAEAGLGTGTFYLYYPGKNELLQALFQHLWTELYARLSIDRLEDPENEIRRLLSTFVEYMLEDHDRALLYLNEHRRAEIMQASEAWLNCMALGQEAIAKGVAQGTFINYDVSVGRATLFGGVRGIIEHLLDNPDEQKTKIDASMTMLVKMLRKI